MKTKKVRSELSYADRIFHPDNPDPLPEKAKELFKLIESETQHSPHGWISRKIGYFAFELGISIRYTQKLIKRLLTADLIEIVRRENNFYRVKSASIHCN